MSNNLYICKKYFTFLISKYFVHNNIKTGFESKLGDV